MYMFLRSRVPWSDRDVHVERYGVWYTGWVYRVGNTGVRDRVLPSTLLEEGSPSTAERAP